MSQLFETDPQKWLPEDLSVPSEDRIDEMARVTGFLAVTMDKLFQRLEKLEQRFAEKEARNG